MRYFLICVFIFIGIAGFSQRFSSDAFHEGFLVTSSRDTLKGDLKYDLETNVVTILSKGRTKSFSSHKVF
ncbi:MAG: hypothetical protein AAF391_01645, partial [Bacteroidota bacterium]